MRVLVTGGTGTLGRPAARRLLERGHEVRVLTRQLSPALPGGAAAVRGDLSTGAGVAQAVERADAVLHAASNTGLGLGRGDVEATRRLLDAALGAGVAHLLYVSIVGIDRSALPGRVARGFRLGLNTCPANASGGPRWVEHVARISG